MNACVQRGFKSCLVQVEASSGPASCGPAASTDQMRGGTFTEWWWETKRMYAVLRSRRFLLCWNWKKNLLLGVSEASLADCVPAWRLYIIDRALQASCYSRLFFQSALYEAAVQSAEGLDVVAYVLGVQLVYAQTCSAPKLRIMHSHDIKYNFNIKGQSKRPLISFDDSTV